MSYKGFEGKAQWDSDIEMFTGNVTNTRTVITFQGQTARETEREFRASVDDYLDWCQEDGVESEVPDSALTLAQ